MNFDTFIKELKERIEDNQIDYANLDHIFKQDAISIIDQLAQKYNNSQEIKPSKEKDMTEGTAVDADTLQMDKLDIPQRKDVTEEDTVLSRINCDQSTSSVDLNSIDDCTFVAPEGEFKAYHTDTVEHYRKYGVTEGDKLK